MALLTFVRLVPQLQNGKVTNNAMALSGQFNLLQTFICITIFTIPFQSSLTENACFDVTKPFNEMMSESSLSQIIVHFKAMIK